MQKSTSIYDDACYCAFRKIFRYYGVIFNSISNKTIVYHQQQKNNSDKNATLYLNTSCHFKICTGKIKIKVQTFQMHLLGISVRAYIVSFITFTLKTRTITHEALNCRQVSTTLVLKVSISTMQPTKSKSIYRANPIPAGKNTCYVFHCITGKWTYQYERQTTGMKIAPNN